MTPEERLYRSLPLFDGFPYIWTRLVPAFYHIILLPGAYSVSRLTEITRKQAQANNLPTCLVLDPAECIYFYPEGQESVSDRVPRGGMISGKLKTCRRLPRSKELLFRSKKFAAFQEQQKGGRYIVGDGSAGRRKATKEELKRLSGNQTNGVPKGLVQCSSCGEWRGSCLSSNPNFAGLLFQVDCRCDNNNFCARCGSHLHNRKLNANFYRQDIGEVLYVPGFCGLNHKCAGREYGT